MIKVDLPKAVYSFSANSYILTSGDECCIIDPAIPYSSELFSGKMKYIILTHCHFDHIHELESWVKNTGAEVLVSADDGAGLSDPNVNCYAVFFKLARGYFGDYTEISNGDIIKFGEDELSVLACPGHTKGSVALIGRGIAFVGDTLFCGGGYGRCDLPGGDFSKLKESILRLMKLPKDTVLYPGHGVETTVSEYSASINF